MMTSMPFYSGTSGLLVPIPKRDFPPEFTGSSRLTFYGHLFNSIEINASFYKLPQHKTLQRWAAEVPDNFRFTFKLWKAVTHNKGLQYQKQDIVDFFKAINVVGNKKGALLLQFPGSIKADQLFNLGRLLADIREIDPDADWDVSIEFRDRSWYNDTVYQLLQDNRAGLVYQDMPASATPLIEPLGNSVYLRFHGPEGRYRGSYPDDHLHEYANYIREWLDGGYAVYVYFNNTAGDALNNLQLLNHYVNPVNL